MILHLSLVVFIFDVLDFSLRVLDHVRNDISFLLEVFSTSTLKIFAKFNRLFLKLDILETLFLLILQDYPFSFIIFDHHLSHKVFFVEFLPNRVLLFFSQLMFDFSKDVCVKSFFLLVLESLSLIDFPHLKVSHLLLKSHLFPQKFLSVRFLLVFNIEQLFFSVHVALVLFLFSLFLSFFFSDLFV